MSQRRLEAQSDRERHETAPARIGERLVVPPVEQESRPSHANPQSATRDQAQAHAPVGRGNLRALRIRIVAQPAHEEPGAKGEVRDNCGMATGGRHEAAGQAGRLVDEGGRQDRGRVG